MASIDDGEFFLCARDASEDQLRRGLVAAKSVLEEAGVSLGEAMAAALSRDILIDNARSLDELTDDERRQLRAWDDARSAAAERCGGSSQDDPVDIGSVVELRTYGVKLDYGPHFEIRNDPNQLALTL